jgi:hypothetical protein
LQSKNFGHSQWQKAAREATVKRTEKAFIVIFTKNKLAEVNGKGKGITI